MINEGIDYNKTVETNKLVFEGQTFNKPFDSFFLILMIVPGALVLCYFIFTTQLENQPTNLDYFVAIFFPTLIIIAVGLFINAMRTLYRLREFDIDIDLKKEKVKEKLFVAAKKLEWEPYLIRDNYLIFKTKNVLPLDSQIVTLVFFPDNRIYFNSLNYTQTDKLPTRFDYNYQSLKTEFEKIDKTKTDC